MPNATTVFPQVLAVDWVRVYTSTAMTTTPRTSRLLPRVPPHHMFLGVQDIPMSNASSGTGLMQVFNLLRSTPGYIGSWPAAGFLDMLPFNLGGTAADANGFSKLPFGLWRRQGGGFSVLSFDPQLLAQFEAALVENE
jgi:hypothetical protein